MSFTIIHNTYSKGCTLIITDRTGKQKRIPCANTATAEFEARLFKAKRS